MSLWNDIPLHLTLRDILGLDDTSIGAMLVEKWRFPSNLIETIRHLHDDNPTDSDMMACVYAGNQISKHLGYNLGASGTQHEWPFTVSRRLGGTLNEIVGSLEDLTQMIDEADYFSKL
jgi:HD-like signal output (HDOD) protein